MGKKITTIDFVNEAIKVHGETYSYERSVYIKAKEKLCIVCNVHGEFYQSPNKHIGSKTGCPKCSGKATKTTTGVIEEARQVHNDKYDYSLLEYKNTYSPLHIICNTHGDFRMHYRSHVALKRGCPRCRTKQSKGESVVDKVLTKLGISFIREKRFTDCKASYPLPFDFFLPAYNTCVEYDGIQHFEVINYFGGKVGFEDRQQRDMIKTDYCKLNKIQLIRIPYTEIENVHGILKRSLQIDEV